LDKGRDSLESIDVIEQCYENLLLASHLKLSKTGQIFEEDRNRISTLAHQRIQASSRNKTLAYLKEGGLVIAVLGCIPAVCPRVYKQKAIFYEISECHTHLATKWLGAHLQKVSGRLPRYTVVGAKPTLDGDLREGFEKAGFTIRYEQTIGTVESSWNRLMELKDPPATLEHLGLKIMPITLESEIPQILDLHRKVGQSSGFHTYFSHQKTNLLAEQQVLKEIINLGKGCLLGVYKEKTLLGTMYCHIGQAMSLAETEGGMSFMLDPSIQNLGIVKTGYRLIFEFLMENKIPNFVGTTSQPAIKLVSDYLDRRPQMMIYLKSTTLGRA
jgi:hypothetical protein